MVHIPYRRIALTGVLTILTSAAVIAVAGAVYYTYVLPGQIGKAYLRDLRTSTKQVKHALSDTAATADSSLFFDIDTPPNTNLATVDSIRTSIAACLTEMRQYQQTARKLKPIKYPVFAGPYKQAIVEQRQAGDVVSQVDEVMGEYQHLLSYLETLNKVQDTYEQKTTAINSVTFLNTLSPGFVTSEGQEINRLADELQREQAPDQLKATQADTVNLFRQTAAGYTQLASGLRTANDAVTDLGIHAIEHQTTLYETKIKNSTVPATSRSVILADIYALPGKTSLVIP